MTRIAAVRAGWTKHIRDVDCPDEEGHTVNPSGYLHWHEWAEKMAKTHHQILCPGCNHYAIWVPGVRK